MICYNYSYILEMICYNYSYILLRNVKATTGCMYSGQTHLNCYSRSMHFGDHVISIPFRVGVFSLIVVMLFIYAYQRYNHVLDLLAYSLNIAFQDAFAFNLSRAVRKPAFCIRENKDADQLRGNREADQRLCFRYIDSTIPLLSKSKISIL